jgi:hypothetical protein
MYEPPQGEDILSSSKHINVKVSQINKQQTWKTPIPASVAWTHKQAEGAGKTATVIQGNAKVNAIKTLVLLSQINAVAAQQQEINTWQLLILYILAAIGTITVWWKVCQLGGQIAEWLFPLEPEELVPTQGAEVQLQIQGSQDSAECEVHGNPQWRKTSNQSRKCSNGCASGSPAAVRSRTDSSSCRKVA